MAFIDAALDTIVIRIVYDGPPLAGKTTSVRALASGMGSAAQSPEELDGRTVYFDWLEYTGGLFEGRRIRCQIVSVPGQTMLASRRRYLLESADSVVFVTDSTTASTTSMVNYLKALQTVLGSSAGPPVGIVVQANQRDRADATPLVELRGVLDAAQLRVGVIESIATDGSGVRETFIFAVRLALDRVRELMQLNALRSQVPRINSAQDLLADMQSLEGSGLAWATTSGLTLMRPIEVAPSALAAEALREATSGAHNAAESSRTRADGDTPKLPDSRLPSGMIWPPVNGRLILDEATQGKVTIQQCAFGHWTANAQGRYLFQSPRHARYAHLDQGRMALIQWARMHAASTRVLSANRCIVLAVDGQDHYRLWQVVRTETSLRDALDLALERDVDTVALAVWALCEQFVLAADLWLSAACALPLTSAVIGSGPHGCRYLGEMPVPEQARGASAFSTEQILEVLLSEDYRLKSQTAPDHRIALARALERLAQRGAHDVSGALFRQFAARYAALSDGSGEATHLRPL